MDCTGLMQSLNLIGFDDTNIQMALILVSLIPTNVVGGISFKATEYAIVSLVAAIVTEALQWLLVAVFISTVCSI